MEQVLVHYVRDNIFFHVQETYRTMGHIILKIQKINKYDFSLTRVLPSLADNLTK